MVNEQKIRTLGFPENIRTRPGMYIGSTHNPTVILREIVDNCKDEGLLGFATKCEIITADTYCIVVDDGRGVPVYIKEDTGKSAAVDIFSSTHTGGKFDDEDGSATVGLNGVGSKATNALSSIFVAYVNLKKKDLTKCHPWIKEEADKLDNPVYKLSFVEGQFSSEMILDKSTINSRVLAVVDNVGDDWGTAIYFEPDPTMWTTTKTQYNIDSLKVSMLYLNGKMSIKLNGEEAPMYTLDDKYHQCGLITVSDQNYWTLEGDASTTDPLVVCKYLIQLGWSGIEFDSRSDGSVNTVSTPSGVHITNAAKGVGQFINEVDSTLDWRDASYGMRLFSLVMTNKAMFNSQTKEHLASITDYNANLLAASVKDKCLELYNSDRSFKSLVNKVIERIHEYKKLMGNMSLTEQVSSEIVLGASSRSNLLRNSKVKDCNTKNRAEAELFVVEGDSAAGSLIQSRNRDIHAIMPLRGKSLNATSASMEQLLESEEFKSLFNVIGAGIHPYNVDMSHCRYGKIIIAADEDADGKHIAALLLGAFGTHLPQIIENGILYLAESPLYEQDGEFFLASERHLLDDNKPIIRNKGLGGLDPKDIATFLFSDRRVLRQVTVDGLQDALDLIRTSEGKSDLVSEMGLVLASQYE